MTLPAVKSLSLVTLALAIVCLIPCGAVAQEITYYNFDDAVTNSGPCSNAPATDPLLCLNPGTVPTPAINVFQTVTYPANMSPSGSHKELLMNTGVGGAAEGDWFSQPQKVTNGFTTYFAVRMQPTSSTADGMVFVIQNAGGGGTTTSGPDGAPSSCSSTGAGDMARGSTGGCIGYGGIPNSLAIELDTWHNAHDPVGDANVGAGGANHIAMQSCGTLPNSPAHDSTCQVHDDTNTAHKAYSGSLPVTLADSQIHEVVIEYTGDLGTPAHYWSIWIDPDFLTGTHTPCPSISLPDCPNGSTPVISLTYNLGTHLNLITTADGQDSAFVGFTASTGGFYEAQELLAWTYTPHAPVTQQQPINPVDTPTTFPYGQHTYATEYTTPPDDGTLNTTDMIVDATTIDPLLFPTLLVGTPYQGSSCQVYEGTGGNCIIYSVHCVDHAAPHAKKPCPSTSDPTIAIKTAYESTGAAPISPGFLQGDPLYAQIDSITASGGTGTVTCTGECGVVNGQQHVSIYSSDNSLTAVDVQVTVAPNVVDSFTYPTNGAVTATASGGFVTSPNVTNICNPPGDPVPCWQAAKIDGTTSGKTKSFSDFVALYQTINVVGTQTAISAPGITYGDPAAITVSVSPSVGSSTVPGSVSLSGDGIPATSHALSSGSTTFSIPAGLTAGGHPLSASYPGAVGFLLSSTSGSLVVGKANPTIQVSLIDVPYDGNPHAATGTITGVSGGIAPVGDISFLYDGSSSTPPTSGGVHAVHATYPGDSNYNSGSADTTLTIETATATVQVSGGSYPYDGNPHAATGGTVTGVGNAGLGAATITYNGSSTVPVNVGTYNVVATFPGDSNYGPASATAQIVITPATATVQISGGTFPYDGNPHPATNGSVAGVGGAPLGAPTVTYNGSSTVPVDAGTYNVLASFSDPNYNPASATAQIQINKATPTVHVTGGTYTFDGNQHSATGSVIGVNNTNLGTPTFLYDGSSSTAPSGVGTHPVHASFAGDTNYNPASADTTISIGVATATVNLAGGSFPYDGLAHAAVATAKGLGGVTLSPPPTITYNGSPTAPSNAGSYAVVASFAGNANYGAASSTATLIINKATPVVTVVGGTFVFSGTARPATGAVTGMGGANLGAPTFSYTPGGSAAPVNPGIYSVLGTYPGSTNYNPASGTATITIGTPLSVTPSILNFGDVNLGSRKSLNVTVKNVSALSLKITNITFIYGLGPSRKNYGYYTQCGGTLKPGNTCTIRVELYAQDVGPGASLLIVSYNQPGSPAVVGLIGNVINPRARLSTSSLSFGTQKVNTSVTKTVILTSSGDTPLSISNIAISGTDFTRSHNCPASLSPNNSCTISVTFKPTAKVSRSGALSITDNASSSPQTVGLSGKGN